MSQRSKDPLSYLLAVMNDPNANSGRRDKAAVAALPYCHPKVEPKGKKAKVAEAVKTVGKGTKWGRDLVYEDGRPPQ